MVKWQADRLVERFRRECRRVSAGLADALDLPVRLWNLLAEWDCVTPEVVLRLRAHVPAKAKCVQLNGVLRGKERVFLSGRKPDA